MAKIWPNFQSHLLIEKKSVTMPLKYSGVINMDLNVLDVLNVRRNGMTNE